MQGTQDASSQAPIMARPGSIRKAYDWLDRHSKVWGALGGMAGLLSLIFTIFTYLQPTESDGQSFPWGLVGGIGGLLSLGLSTYSLSRSTKLPAAARIEDSVDDDKQQASGRTHRFIVLTSGTVLLLTFIVFVATQVLGGKAQRESVNFTLGKGQESISLHIASTHSNEKINKGLAETFFRAGNDIPEKALEYYESATKNDPGNMPAWRALAHSHYQNGDFDSAARSFWEVLRVSTESEECQADAFHYLGLISLKRGAPNAVGLLYQALGKYQREGNLPRAKEIEDLLGGQQR